MYNTLFEKKNRWTKIIEQSNKSRSPRSFCNGNDIHNRFETVEQFVMFDSFWDISKLIILFTGDWRIFKKKKSIILPILILLNLIKLKLLILPIFLGVHFIKKLLVLGSLILPSVLAHLKICKVQQPHAYAHKNTHPFHLWSSAAEAPADYPSGKTNLENYFFFVIKK